MFPKGSGVALNLKKSNSRGHLKVKGSLIDGSIGQTLIDPGAKKTDLLIGQFLTLANGRHLIIQLQMSHIINQ